MENPPPPMAPSGPPSPRRGRGNWWGLGAFLALLAGKLKFFLPVLKFLPLVLKTGGSMLLMIGVYTLMFGWKFAVGFVLLIFVHEIGHVLAAQRCGVRVSAPFFIPFFGALIMLKELPRNAWTEARIAIGGPLLGAVAAGACHALHVATGHPLLLVLAYFGYWLNLFNLAPVGFFDGGRIVTAISPWMWLVGFSALGTLVVWRFRDSYSVGSFIEHNFILLVVLFFALPRIFWLFGSRKSPEQLRYFEVTGGQRATMAVLYFGLAGLLAAGMFASKVAITALDLR
jgi:Zn-dependent protease